MLCLVEENEGRGGGERRLTQRPSNCRESRTMVPRSVRLGPGRPNKYTLLFLNHFKVYICLPNNDKKCLG